MGYDNNGGCCNSGFGFPFGGFMNGFGGFGFDALILLLFFGLMGGGMWGGMGGWGMGGFGGGAGMLGATSLAATETASLISQNNTADRVSAIAADTRQILGQTGGIIEAVNTVGNRTQDGFARVDTSLCQLGNNIAMQAVNNHNNLTSQLTEMRFANQQCCCDTKQLIQSSFCDLRHQMQVDKGETIQSMNANTAAIMARIDCLEKTAMQDKLNAANERNAELKARIDNQNQTNTLLAAIQAGQRGYAPCGPYAPFCNPCVDGIQRAVNDALGTRIGEILFPTTTPAAA